MSRTLGKVSKAHGDRASANDILDQVEGKAGKGGKPTIEGGPAMTEEKPMEWPTSQKTNRQPQTGPPLPGRSILRGANLEGPAPSQP